MRVVQLPTTLRIQHRPSNSYISLSNLPRTSQVLQTTTTTSTFSSMFPIDSTTHMTAAFPVVTTETPAWEDASVTLCGGDDGLWFDLPDGDDSLPLDWFPTNIHVDNVQAELHHHATLEVTSLDIPTNNAKHLATITMEDEDDGVDTSGMTKDELRKHKNRASAARARQRTRSRMEYLEKMVADLQAKNHQLQQTLAMLQHQQQTNSGSAFQVPTMPFM